MRYCQSAKVTGQALYISGSKTHWLKMKALAPARHGGFAEPPRFKFFLLLIKFCRTDLGVFPTCLSKIALLTPFKIAMLRSLTVQPRTYSSADA